LKALIVFAHPDENSFNGAVLGAVKNVLTAEKAEHRIKDLYRMKWNPLLTTGDLQQLYNGQVPPDIAAEQADIRWADMLMFIYPIWWYEQPAILKGWIDRVMSHGFAYRMTETGMIEGLLKGKKAIVFTTSGADKESMDKNGITDAINTSMIKGTLGFSGFEKVQYKNLHSVPSVSDEERKQMLGEVEEMLRASLRESVTV
jgi:NAD(P)H dehydrogenase (quinone)